MRGYDAMTIAIEILNVEKRYGALQALAGVSLAVAEGEFFGLLGPNGAGKTTLISIIAGLARPTAGTVRVMGADVGDDYRRARRMLGVVPQELVFDPFFTVRETLRLQSGYFGLRRNDAWIDEVMHHLDLAGKADANMRTLSGGMKRRVLVAQALVHRPPVIVLDEPTAGVDVELRQGLWEFVRGLNRDGHTIVLTTHYLEEAEALCGRIAMLKEGRIVALDTTSNLVNRMDNLYLKLRIAGAALPAALAARVRNSRDAVHTLRLRSFAEVEGVLAQVREAGALIEELELLQPDLEDVFVQIMNMEEGGERRGGRSATPASPVPASPNR
jgi:ABC-2 type transport system ATP-binding protein